MKLATIAKFPPRQLGGFEREMISLSRMLVGRGHRHVIYFSEEISDSLRTRLEEAGATVNSCKINSSAGVRTLLTNLRQEKIDLAHLHFFRVFGHLGPIIRISCRKPVLVTEHMGLPILKRSPAKQALVRARASMVSPFLTKILCVSDYVKQRLIESDLAPENKMLRIYNGIEIDALASAAEIAECKNKLAININLPVVCSVAYAAPGKGVEKYVEAAINVLSSGMEAIFIHVGDGPLVEHAKELAQQAGLVKNIYFMGHQENVRPWMALADIMVIPSDGPEGLPFTALEAMAESRPLVATITGGVPEAVVDGETGILVERGNSLALAEAILRLLHNPEQARRYGQSGRKRVEQNFDLRRKVAETVALYERIVCL